MQEGAASWFQGFRQHVVLSHSFTRDSARDIDFGGRRADCVRTDRLADRRLEDGRSFTYKCESMATWEEDHGPVCPVLLGGSTAAG